MKILINIAVASLLLAHTQTQAAAAKNCDELLSINSSKLTLGALHYDQFNPDFFRQKLKEDLRKAKRNLKAVQDSNQPPTFANTIEALEYLSTDMEHTWTVVSNYLEIMKSDGMTKLHAEFNPQITKFSSDVFYNVKIFRRVEKVYNKRHSLNLNDVQLRLLEKTYQAYLNNGINLDKAKQDRLTAITVKIGKLAEEFKNNTVNETEAYALIVTDAKDLAGLPDKVIEAAAKEAKKRGHSNAWAFTLSYPSYGPFMEKAENRELRKKLWSAFSRRGTSGSYDNRLILLELVKLRTEKAQILGYKTFADMILKNRMAKKTSTVMNFINRLSSVYKPKAEQELKELEAFAGHPIEPWDGSYYATKLEEKTFNIDNEELKNYFPIDQVLQGAFYAAEKLFKVHFVERKDLPVWHKDVRVFEVRNPRNDVVALYYLDPYPRDGKRGGAYMSGLRPTGFINNEMLRPHVVNVTNTAPPSDAAPALMSLDNARTQFHELGHGLHEMLTQVYYPSMAGTNVFWDGVELPSQLNEKWQFETEVLEKFARHYKTGQPLDKEIIKQIKAADNFRAATRGLGQMQLATIDMAWYSEDVSSLKTVEDVESFENKAVADLILRPRQGAFTSGAFAHIFAGGYTAGYYSYKWAENLVANFHAVFEKNGMYDPETATRYLELVLSKGGTADFDILVRLFLGQEPDPDALLRSEGLIP